MRITVIYAASCGCVHMSYKGRCCVNRCCLWVLYSHIRCFEEKKGNAPCGPPLPWWFHSPKSRRFVAFKKR